MIDDPDTWRGIPYIVGYHAKTDVPLIEWRPRPRAVRLKQAIHRLEDILRDHKLTGIVPPDDPEADYDFSKQITEFFHLHLRLPDSQYPILLSFDADLWPALVERFWPNWEEIECQRIIPE